MQSLSKCDKAMKYLLCAIDLYSKYAWVVPLKDTRGSSTVNPFQEIISKGDKPNKIWVDQGGEYYNKLFTRILGINNIEMHSTFNVGESVVAGRFIRDLESKIFNYMTAISKSVYFHVLDDVEKHNSSQNYENKTNYVTSDYYAECNENFNEKDPKFKVGDHVIISKYKNNFAKEYTENWSEEIFVVSKIKNSVPWTYVISDLDGEEIDETFYEKELQKTNQREFRIEKTIKRKGTKLFEQWKGYVNS